MVREEAADIVTQVFVGDGRDVDRQDDLEAVTADPPAHDFFGVGVDAAPGCQHPGPAATSASTVTSATSAMSARCSRICRGPVGALGDDDCGPVTKEAGGNQICHRIVLALNSQGAQFDRDQRSHLTGKCEQVIVHARRPRRAGHTAQAEQWDTLDVLAQSDPRGQPRLQGRHGKSGHRRRKDDVDLRRLDPRLVKCREKRLLSQVEGDLDVEIVRLREAAELAVLRKRQRGVAEVNPTFESEPPKFRAGEVGQRADGFVLGAPVWRKLHSDSCDGRLCCRNSGR